MTVIQGILLGMLQGLAEFLPISSSGHLKIAQTLFGLGEVPLLFDVFLHLATLAAVVLYFWKKIWELIKAFGRIIARRPLKEEKLSDDILTGNDFMARKTVWAIILSTIVTGALGVVSSKLIPEMGCKVVCTGFLVTSALLIVSSQIQKRQAARETQSASEAKPVSWGQALIIGLMQGFGTLPGISRSGSTIAGALFCGVDRKAAGEYSFIVSIPAILGAFILEVKDLGDVNSTIGAAPVIAGCAAAFAVGYISLACLMKLIRKGKLEWFAAYLIPVGILGIIFL